MKCEFDLETLKFDDRGLIPAVVTEAGTGKLLMLAYMNRESLEISIREEITCFWSRSRQELWRKGETSGNRQHIVRITADCDLDALQVVVKKDGPACIRVRNHASIRRSVKMTRFLNSAPKR